MNPSIFLRLALFGYFLSTAAFLVHIIRRHPVAGRMAQWVIGLAFGLQTVYLTAATIDLGQLPVLNIAGAFGFLGWSLAGAYLILAWRYKLLILGALASPLALVFVFFSIFIDRGQTGIGAQFKNIWLTFHLGTVFFGYAFLGLAFLAGVIYLLQEKQIKAKRTGAIYHRLPSLSVLDDLNYTCLTIGFPLMTLGLISGAAYAQIALGAYWRWDPKEIWSLVMWLFYAVLLHQRLTVGWRGRRAAIMAIIGFSLLGLTFIGVGLIMPGYHSFESLRQLSIQ